MLLTLSVTRDLAYLMLGKYGQFVISLLTIPIVARQLDVDGMGALAIGISANFFSAVLVDFGLSQVLSARTAADGVPGTVRNAYGVIRWAMTGLVVVVAAPLIVFGGPALQVLGTGLIAGAISGLNDIWILYGSREFGQVSVVQVVVRLAYFGGVAATISIVPSPHTVIVWLALSNVATNITVRRLAGAPEKVRPSRADVMMLFHLGIPVVAARMLTASYTQGASLLQATVLSPVQIGLFSAGDRLVRSVQSVLDALGLALLPRVSKLRSESLQRYWRSVWLSIGIGFAAAMVAAGVLAVAAPFLISILYGPKFEEAVPLLRLEVLLLPGAAVVAITTNVLLYVQEDGRTILIGAGIGLLSMLVGVAVMSVHPSTHVAVYGALLAEWLVAIWFLYHALKTWRAETAAEAS